MLAGERNFKLFKLFSYLSPVTVAAGANLVQSAVQCLETWRTRHPPPGAPASQPRQSPPRQSRSGANPDLPARFWHRTPPRSSAGQPDD